VVIDCVSLSFVESIPRGIDLTKSYKCQ
jgi:hypothetical protein